MGLPKCYMATVVSQELQFPRNCEMRQMLQKHANRIWQSHRLGQICHASFLGVQSGWLLLCGENLHSHTHQPFDTPPPPAASITLFLSVGSAHHPGSPCLFVEGLFISHVLHQRGRDDPGKALSLTVHCLHPFANFCLALLCFAF